MAHTAGPDASLASIVVDVWNWVSAHAAALNQTRDKAFEQLSPSLRRFITSTNAEMHDRVDAQIAWRIPLGFDIDGFVSELLQWTAAHVGAPTPAIAALAAIGGEHVTVAGERTMLEFRFRGWEQPWKADRANGLVRSFLSAIRTADAHVQPGFVFKTGTSDMNVVAPVWRCPIVAYGPGDSALDHTPNEHLSLDEYWRAIEVVERMLRAFARG